MSCKLFSIRADHPMKSPKRTFMVNDVVRLNRGWTPMTINWISPDGQVSAYYGIQDFNPDGEEYPDCPTASYTRHQSGWTFWDGEFVPGRNLLMARKFIVNNRSSMEVGLFTGFTSTGLMILEFVNNQVEVFAENEVTEVKPFSFTVRYMGGSFEDTATYTFEDSAKRVEINDVLVSDGGDFCVVVKIDVNANRPKSFSGRRVLTAEI